MPPILVVLNLIALLFAMLILMNLSKAYKILFLSAMLLPILIWFSIAIVAYPQNAWGFTEVVMMLLRGIFILGVISGTLACYIITKLKK